MTVGQNCGHYDYPNTHHIKLAVRVATCVKRGRDVTKDPGRRLGESVDTAGSAASHRDAIGKTFF